MPDLAVNRRAFHDYEILERYEAGIALLGAEAKSIKNGRGNLGGAFVLIRTGEAWLANAAVAPYQPKNTPVGYDPARPRKLLLHQAELKALIGKSAERGLTLVPLRMYAKGQRIKLEFAVARRRKNRDKRDRIRAREDARHIERTLREH